MAFPGCVSVSTARNSIFLIDQNFEGESYDFSYYQPLKYLFNFCKMPSIAYKKILHSRYLILDNLWELNSSNYWLGTLRVKTLMYVVSKKIKERLDINIGIEVLETNR